MEETSGGADIAAWQFFGPGRVAELTMGNGLIMSHMNNARTRSAIQDALSTPAWGDDSSDRLGYDGAGRPITKRYLAGDTNGSHAYDDPTSVVGFTTAYDRSSNKFYERHLHAESRSHLYEPYSDGAPTGGYDSIDRLRQYQRGILSTTGGSSSSGGGSITTPISLPGTNEFRNYDLDGLGNWRRTSFEPVGDDEQLEIRQHNGLNQITRTDDGTDQVNFAYDGGPGASNGNLANDGVRSYEWDALNRLVRVYNTPDAPILIGEYVYDALNRRIRKTVSNGGLSSTIPNGTTDFIYTDWQCVEERDDEDDPIKQYVWGTYIDELLQQKTFVTINGNAAGNYYPLSDLLYRTTALTDSSGDIVEAYDCDAYGNTLIFTAVGTGDDWWADDAVSGSNSTCHFAFAGCRLETELGLYNFRTRLFDPITGRFINRDPIGPRADTNLYQYATGNPTRYVDPYGLMSEELILPAWVILLDMAAAAAAGANVALMAALRAMLIAAGVGLAVLALIQAALWCWRRCSDGYKMCSQSALHAADLETGRACPHGFKDSAFGRMICIKRYYPYFQNQCTSPLISCLARCGFFGGFKQPTFQKNPPININCRDLCANPIASCQPFDRKLEYFHEFPNIKSLS